MCVMHMCVHTLHVFVIQSSGCASAHATPVVHLIGCVPTPLVQSSRTCELRTPCGFSLSAPASYAHPLSSKNTPTLLCTRSAHAPFVLPTCTDPAQWRCSFIRSVRRGVTGQCTPLAYIVHQSQSMVSTFWSGRRKGSAFIPRALAFHHYGMM